MLRLDHLVIVAPALDAGVAHVRACLGIDMPEGGRHREMGTRNHLLRLGDAVFLEVVAIDPGAAPPSRPRWFGLDDAARVRADWEEGRRLRGFVARTDDLDGVLAAHPLLGAASTLTRGALSWRFGLRPDGTWPAGGAMPHVMDWGAAGNPAGAMPDLGARLVRLTLEHPDPPGMAALYETIGIIDPPELRAGRSRYSAEIATRAGRRMLF